MPSPARPTDVGRLAAALVAALLLGACAAGADAPAALPGSPAAVDPAAADRPDAHRADADHTDTDPGPEPGVDVTGAHEVVLVADLGPLPDGTGRAVVESTWRTDAAGTVHLTIATPAGITEQHVWTADAHWWWLHPEARRTVADAEWIHFDLPAVEEVGGDLPDVVTVARQPPPQPDGIGVGDLVAGREVQAVDVVDVDEVHLTVARIEEPVVLRRRALPADARIDPPPGAVDVADLPGLLRW